MTEWFKIPAAATYSGLSERKMRDLLKEGLRHSRLKTGTILIKRAWIDEYLESFEHQENKVETIISEVMEGLK